MKAVNIKWDVSEDDMDSDDIMECLSELPNEIEIPKDMTGFCHDGFTIID